MGITGVLGRRRRAKQMSKIEHNNQNHRPNRHEEAMGGRRPRRSAKRGSTVGQQQDRE
jgi:hypothetical protein